MDLYVDDRECGDGQQDLFKPEYKKYKRKDMKLDLKDVIDFTKHVNMDMVSPISLFQIQGWNVTGVGKSSLNRDSNPGPVAYRVNALPTAWATDILSIDWLLHTRSHIPPLRNRPRILYLDLREIHEAYNQRMYLLWVFTLGAKC